MQKDRKASARAVMKGSAREICARGSEVSAPAKAADLPSSSPAARTRPTEDFPVRPGLSDELWAMMIDSWTTDKGASLNKSVSWC